MRSRDTEADSTDPVTDAATVMETVHAIMHLYRARQFRTMRNGPHDLTHMESKALGYFARHPGATQSDLMAHSGRDKAQLARLVRGLRDRGLLEATVDEMDRRSTHLHVTAEGKAISRALQRSGEVLAEVAVTGLDEAQRRQLLALLAQVKKNLDAAEE
ncbi:DNA-binding MarR family transcriptional regulator [Pseudoduganella lurida]|uniref:DNA-binding MarR family transcriptional regulator n=1 Tax=Pseudoduganella lurida TaxID=1036180 RepID=A0A562QYF8_9BURK|nr:MarR family winged helix-turn-helix transcriptional regulator [Pseudoduganella lurida]TWI61166.1 DNA-binding MarR family transcriptional regulator [Pseudoduganella lurida]